MTEVPGAGPHGPPLEPEPALLDPGEAAPPAPRRPEDAHRGLEILKDNIEAFTIALIVALVIKHYCVEAFKIPTGSMAPTLFGEKQSPIGVGDRILVDKWAYLLHPPERWDVVVFRYPLNQSKHFIKRLVGREGEWINVARGDIWVRSSADAPWHIATKRRRVREELYLPVYPPNGKERPREPAAHYWETSSPAWKAIDYGTLSYAGGEPATATLREKIGREATPETFDFGQPLTPVQDVRVHFHVRPEAEGALDVRWHSPRGEIVDLRLATPGGETSRVTSTGLGEDQAREIGARLARGADTEVELECVDGQVYVELDDEEVAHLDLGVTMAETTAFADAPQQLEIEASGAALRIGGFEVSRDLYYGTGQFPGFGPGGTGTEIPAGHFFMMGDNTDHSSDSRKWDLRGVELTSGRKVWFDTEDNRLEGQYGEWRHVVDDEGIERRWRREEVVRSLSRRAPFVPRRLIVGRAWFIFWPVYPDPPGRFGFIH